MKKILITGASGFIGGSTAIRLKELGHTVVGIDLVTRKHLSKYFDMFCCGDYVDMLKPEFANHNFSHIIHCAGTSLVHPSFVDPSLYYVNNVAKTIELINWIKNYSPSTQIIFSSSASVYKTNKEVLNEEDELEPLSPYAKTKKMVEDVIFDVHDSNNLNFTIFRYFNACGALGSEHGQEPNATHIFPRLFETRRFGGLFTQYGDSTRDYIHIRDIVDAHVQAINNSTVGVFNLGNRHGYKSSEIINWFVKKIGDLNVAIMPKRKGEADRLVADITRANYVLKWNPRHDIDDVLIDLRRWYDSDNYKEQR